MLIGLAEIAALAAQYGIDVAELAALAGVAEFTGVSTLSASLTSSALSAASYDLATQTLTLDFINGGGYDYPGVPPNIFAGLVTAPSAGQYYHSVIKDNYG